MSKHLKISVIILVLFVIYAPSCVDEQAIVMHEEAVLNETRNEIRTEFETEYLTEAYLFAYEITAKQKLTDFVDYLHIITDTSLDESFREKAGEMIQNTFLSENVTLQLVQHKDDPSGKINVRRLIQLGLKNKQLLPPFSIKSIVVNEPLHRTGNTTYAGSLKFSQVFTGSAQSNKSMNTMDRTADIYINKEEKIFGADTLKIWNVRLGDIR
ncbi:MAG: hypothetical protein K8R86_04145 [Bacteroidales bacterium]|nr:hypothetical protein [Bacteroidales bacterium]